MVIVTVSTALAPNGSVNRYLIDGGDRLSFVLPPSTCCRERAAINETTSQSSQRRRASSIGACTLLSAVFLIGQAGLVLVLLCTSERSGPDTLTAPLFACAT